MCVNFIIFIWFIAGDMVVVRAQNLMTVYFWMIPHIDQNKTTIRLSRCCFLVEIFDFYGSNLTISWRFYVYGKMTCLTCRF